MCRAQARVLTKKELARTYVHAGMIGLNGEKMSKSKGNLVFVSQLIAQGVDPMAIRYALMSVHYRSDRMWNDEILHRSQEMIQKLRLALACAEVSETHHVAQEIILALSDDLDTPRALMAIEGWIEKTLAGASGEMLVNSKRFGCFAGASPLILRMTAQVPLKLFGNHLTRDIRNVGDASFDSSKAFT